MRSLIFLCVAALSACFAPVDDRPDGGSAGGGAAAGGSASAGGSAGGVAGGVGGGTAGGMGGGRAGGAAGGGAPSCKGDLECGPGQGCYDCGSFSACAEGCSPTNPCPGGAQCVTSPVTCLTCPCPQSRCVAPACVDVDGDGYLPQQCQGIPGGDCAPFDATIHPGARENCTNGRDDDCDGLIDARDPSCAPVCSGAASCRTIYDCNLGTTTCMAGGCCGSCPLLSPPRCPPNMCPSPAAPDVDTGCLMDVRCVPCANPCPAVYMPVCAQLSRGDARTFGNRCEATNASATVIHDGACIPGEGISCTTDGPGCNAATYCRDACPECDADLRRCTKRGACVSDVDCPAGLTPPPTFTCAGGAPAALRCVNNACVRSCAP